MLMTSKEAMEISVDLNRLGTMLRCQRENLSEEQTAYLQRISKNFHQCFMTVLEGTKQQEDDHKYIDYATDVRLGQMLLEVADWYDAGACLQQDNAPEVGFITREAGRRLSIPKKEIFNDEAFSM